MYIINAPGFFKVLWMIIKSFLDSRTVSKIKVLRGPEEYLPHLREILSEGSIPIELGGTADMLFKDSAKVFKTVNLSRGVEESIALQVNKHEIAIFKFFLRYGGSITCKVLFTSQDSENPRVFEHKEFNDFVPHHGQAVELKYSAPSTGIFTIVYSHSGWYDRGIVYRGYVKA